MGIIRRDRYVRGTHNAISDDSGQKYKRSDMRLTWDNKLVGADEWDEKHPQLIIRPREDRPAIKDQTRTQTAPTALLDPTFRPGIERASTVVLDSDGNSFTVFNFVKDKDGNDIQIEVTVKDSDGNDFTVFTYT